MIVASRPEFQRETSEAVSICATLEQQIESVTLFSVTPRKVAFACRPAGAINHLGDRVLIIDRREEP